MKKIIRHRSAVPVYAVAATAVIWALFLPLYNLIHLLPFALCCGAAYFAASKIFPGKTETVELPPEPVTTGDAEIDALLRAGDAAVAEMRGIARSARGEAGAKIAAVADTTDRIFRHLIENPSDLRLVRRFSELYLPTTMKMLRAYDSFIKSGAAGENISGTVARIESALDSIIASYGKQYDALFRHQAIDIDTDITALESMMKREGL